MNWQGYGIKDYAGLMPGDLFNWHLLSTVKGLMITVVGGFLVGFWNQVCRCCTSGHAIMGLSNLQMAIAYRNLLLYGRRIYHG